MGGLRAAKLNGAVGILVGSADRVDRNWAVPLADASCLASWATHQANLIFEAIKDPSVQLACAACVLHYGGDPGPLPIAVREDGVVYSDLLDLWEEDLDEVAVVSSMLPMVDDDIVLNPNVLLIYSLHHSSSETSSHKCQAIIWEALAEAWGCSIDEVDVDIDDNYDIGIDRNGNYETAHGVTIFRKPARQN